jgi:hypothetical protein
MWLVRVIYGRRRIVNTVACSENRNILIKEDACCNAMDLRRMSSESKDWRKSGGIRLEEICKNVRVVESIFTKLPTMELYTREQVQTLG